MQNRPLFSAPWLHEIKMTSLMAIRGEKTGYTLWPTSLEARWGTEINNHCGVRLF